VALLVCSHQIGASRQKSASHRSTLHQIELAGNFNFKFDSKKLSIRKRQLPFLLKPSAIRTWHILCMFSTTVNAGRVSARCNGGLGEQDVGVFMECVGLANKPASPRGPCWRLFVFLPGCGCACSSTAASLR
jgi:hypothetical protein